MARHIELNPDNAMKVLDIASTALQTARRLQTRKAANVYIPSGDGTGVLIGDTAENGGISRYDPESETQSPLWEGISQEELDAKADEILGAAKKDTAAQITIVNTTITEAQQAIEANRDGLEQEAYLREEGDKAATAATNAVKAETDKLKGDYAGMATDVASVKQDMLDTVQRVEIAQTTADGKNRRFVQATTPTVPAAELTQGDEWWQTSSEPPETYFEGERPPRMAKTAVSCRRRHRPCRRLSSRRATNGGRRRANRLRHILRVNRTIRGRCSWTIRGRSSTSGHGTAHGGLI